MPRPIESGIERVYACVYDWGQAKAVEIISWILVGVYDVAFASTGIVMFVNVIIGSAG